MNNLLQPTVIQ